jgi:hypothetical protein
MKMKARLIKEKQLRMRGRKQETRSRREPTAQSQIHHMYW